jgi:hypothetical protein
VYDGEWIDSNMHGRGKFTWLDNSASHGNVYDGEWIYNIMHGKGKFTWLDKSS